MTKPPPVYEIERPAELTAPVIFSSPHSGAFYPRHFLEASRLSALELRSSEDCYVDRLFSTASKWGALLIKANYPRAFLDLNREAYELDQSMFKGALPDVANTNSPRVLSGLGTIPKLVSEATPIYKTTLAVEEGLERIQDYYFPYHDALRALIDEVKSHFGFCIVIDCHSMPPLFSKGGFLPEKLTRKKGRKIDFVLGDNFGASCDHSLTASIHQFLNDKGHSVARNQPYAGGFITKRYGRPRQAVQVLQLEIGRDLYMDCQTLKPHEGFVGLKAELTELIGMITSSKKMQQAN